MELTNIACKKIKTYGIIYCNMARMASLYYFCVTHVSYCDFKTSADNDTDFMLYMASTDINNNICVQAASRGQHYYFLECGDKNNTTATVTTTIILQLMFVLLSIFTQLANFNP